MFRCCENDFETPQVYVDHRRECHNTEDDLKLRVCRVCEVRTTDFDKHQRTCRDCINHEFLRCTNCGLVKDRSGFYKSIVYGRCAMCRNGGKVRGAGFAELGEDTRREIYDLLEGRLKYEETDGREGAKIAFIDIAKRFGLKKCNFHAWLRAGKLHPGFARRG